MKHKKFINSIILFLGCIGIYLFISHKEFLSLAQESDALDSPLPTPTLDVVGYKDLALRYVSEKNSIPLEHLVVEYELETPYPLSGHTFMYFLIANARDPQWPTFGISVDVATRAIEEDIITLEQAEREAYQAKYGKLEPALYERLQQIADNDLLPIAVWAAGKAVYTEDEILTILANEFPEAAKAIVTRTKPMDVENPETAAAIQTRYEELLTENSKARLEPLEAWLSQEGYTFDFIEGMPSITATLPKSVIQKISEMDEVGLLYLIEEKGQDELDTAVASDRIPVVWQRGNTGTNVKVAILDDGNIDTSLGCVTVVANRNSPQGIKLHTTKVANIISCNADPFKGVAFGASLVDAGFDSTGYPNPASQTEGIAALKWATESPQSAKVVNISYGWEANSTINWTDRAFDYWAKKRNFTVAKSAGNSASHITSPGKAWNIITVGGSNDQNTASWPNDTIYINSNYKDPTGGESGTDREKPEVVAPAVSITTANGNAAGPDGTSYAAPQVAGLAALLLQRNSQLNSWPEAIKAIIMASALHNVDDVPDIDLTKDLKDGAGAIDAALADQIAQLRQLSATDPCEIPCWWGGTTTSGSPSVGNSFDRYFKANRGERIRVVITWMANADSDTNNYSFDRLDTNFDLRVYTAGGTLVDSALSQKNNYELVDFVAPETTTYRINVKKEAASEDNNSVGIAWVKDATYLPDLRLTTNVLTSTIYIRNNGPLARDIRVTFFNQNGSYKSEQSNSTDPNEVWIVLPPNNWQGSAIIDGGEEIAAVVRTASAGLSIFDNAFTSMGNNSDSAFEQVSTTLYAPALYYNIFGGLNSAIYFQNPNSDSVNGTIYLYNRSGPPDPAPVNFSLPANGSTTYFIGGSSWVGSLRIDANRPIAAKIYEYQGAGTSRSYNATANGRSIQYVPVAYKNDLGFNSTGLVIQNLDQSVSTAYTVTYCDRAFVTCYTEITPSVGPQRAYGINTATTAAIPGLKWNGSVKIQSNSSTPLAVAVTNSNPVGGYDVSGDNIANLRIRTITLPYVAKAAVPNSVTTGYTLRNIGGPTTTTTVKVKYYNLDGSLKDDSRTITLTPGEVEGYHQSNDTFLTNGWEGSIVFESDSDIVVIMREDSATTTAGYNGIPR